MKSNKLAEGYRFANRFDEGELIYFREEARGQLIEFKVKAMDRYFDHQPVQKRISHTPRLW